MKNIFSSFLLLSILCGSFSSCLNKETPVPLKPAGQETVGDVELADDYRWQVYYSLKNNTVVGKNLFTSWDLGFETSPRGNRIILNGAKFRMVAYRTGKQDFAAVTIADTIGVASQIDMPSGSLDSTAIGDWKNGDVYILHRGVDELAADLGMRKIQFVSVDATKYVVRFSALNGADEKTLEIPKDEKYNFCYLSFDGGGKTLTVEPPKTEWDIVFSKYTYLYYDLDMRYSVVGCLLNHFNTSAGEDTASKLFATIDLEKAASVKLSSLVSTIGFEWKSYDINAGKYSIDTSRYYIIHTQDEIFYKVRFIDFYKSGVKGAPKWQYQRL